MQQLTLFEPLPAASAPQRPLRPQLHTSYLQHMVARQQQQVREAHLLLQRYLLRALQAHGWELFQDVFYNPAGQYAALHWERSIFTGYARTPDQAAALAEHAALFYDTRHLPSTYRLPSNTPDYPDAWRFVDGVKIRAINEYHQLWHPRHQSNERYYSTA